MAQLLSSIQPPPFRVPLLDDQGQLVETWARFFLAAQAAIVQILAAKPLALIGSIPPPLDDASGLIDDFANIQAPVTGRISGGAFTQGSVIFAGSGGILSQNNAQFFWDDTNVALGIGTNSPNTDLVGPGLEVKGTQANLILSGSSTTATVAVQTVNDLSSEILFVQYGSAKTGTSFGVNNTNLALFESAGSSALIVGNASAGPLIFGTSNAERMRILSGGNVGIGQTNPNGLLVVAQDSATTAPVHLRLQGATTSAKELDLGYNTTSDYGSIQAVHQGVGFTLLTLNPSGGGVVVGSTIAPTSPASFSVLAGSSLIGGATVGNGGLSPWPFAVNGTFTTIGSLVLGANDYTTFNIGATHVGTVGMGIGGYINTTVSSGTQAALASLVIADASGAGAVTSQAGILIRGLGKGTNNISLLIGTDLIPVVGTVGIYTAAGVTNGFMGSVGVGTTSATTYAPFAVRTFLSIGGVNVSASFSDATFSTFDIRHKSGLVDLSAQGGFLTLSANSAERLRVMAGVSIGDTTDPGATNLRVAGTVAVVGKVTTYNNIATAGEGVPAIYGNGRATAQTGAVASVATYTVGAADGSFLVSMNILITAFTTGTISGVVTYTDEGGTARSLTMNFSAITGVLATTAGAAGAFEGVPLHIRAKASTAITATTTVSVFTGTYNVESYITQFG